MAETSIRKKIAPVKAVLTAGSVHTKLPLALNSRRMAIKKPYPATWVITSTLRAPVAASVRWYQKPTRK